MGEPAILHEEIEVLQLDWASVDHPELERALRMLDAEVFHIDGWMAGARNGAMDLADRLSSVGLFRRTEFEGQQHTVFIYEITQTGLKLRRRHRKHRARIALTRDIRGTDAASA